MPDYSIKAWRDLDDDGARDDLVDEGVTQGVQIVAVDRKLVGIADGEPVYKDLSKVPISRPLSELRTIMELASGTTETTRFEVLDSDSNPLLDATPEETMLLGAGQFHDDVIWMYFDTVLSGIPGEHAGPDPPGYPTAWVTDESSYEYLW